MKHSTGYYIAAGVFLLLFGPGSHLTYAQGKITFEETLHDFGLVEEGDVAKHIFEFVNEGTEAVSITDVMVSCGCTTPEWTETEVAPGEKGVVTVAFNSAGRSGRFRRGVRVTTNGEPATLLLYVQGEVVTEKTESGLSRSNAPAP